MIISVNFEMEHNEFGFNGCLVLSNYLRFIYVFQLSNFIAAGFYNLPDQKKMTICNCYLLVINFFIVVFAMERFAACYF
jgi:hypothetical protein